MKQFLSNNLKKITIFIIIYAISMYIFVMPTNYAIIAPGGITNLKDSFVIEDYEMDNHFYTIYVYSQAPITVFQYLTLQNNDHFEISEITKRQEDTSLYDQFVQGNISKEASYKAAIIEAYNLAGQTNDQINISYEFNGLIIYDFPRRISELAIGQQIIKIDGIDIYEYTFDDAKILAYKNNVIYTILRDDGSTFEYHYTYQEDDVLFWFFPSYDILNAQPSYQYDSINLIGGSSGGLLQTLSIYVSLLKLNINQLVISGTGTIEIGGNVGRIGGIREKITTAEFSKVDIFFIPTLHLDDISDMQYSFEIVSVDTLEEAVNWLYENVIE